MMKSSSAEPAPQVIMQRPIRDVLVVDDNRDHRESVEGVFRKRGWRTKSCEGVASVRELLERSTAALAMHPRHGVDGNDIFFPDLMILDIKLQGSDTGFDVLALFDQLCTKKMGRTSRTVVPYFPTPLTVAMSGEATREQAFLLPIRGVFGYIEKPFSARGFSDLIEEAINDRLRALPSVETVLARTVELSGDYDSMLGAIGRRLVDEALIRAGSVNKAAELLGMSRQRLGKIIDRTKTPEVKQLILDRLELLREWRQYCHAWRRR